jgi:hypothetical protein
VIFVTPGGKSNIAARNEKGWGDHPQPLQWPDDTPHFPEQHCTLLTQGLPFARQEAARAGAGATSEVTKGKAMALAMPIARIISRREVRCSRFSLPTSNLACDNSSSASNTMGSLTGAEN